jgi:hypothetical protein
MALTVSVVGTVLLGGLNCSGDRGPDMTGLVNDPYGALRLNVHTVTLSTIAPYDTVQLVATPSTVSGAAFATTAVPTFTTKDTSLTVSATGLVRAHSVTSTNTGTFVIATLTDSEHQVTHADTVYIVVTNTTPPTSLAAFDIKQTPGDSAKIGVYTSQVAYLQDTLFLVATGEDGSDLRPALASALAVRFTSSDPTVASVTTTVLPKRPTHPVAEVVGLVKGLQPGKVTITVSTAYYGVTKTDSIALTIGNPAIAVVYANTVPSSEGQYILTFVPNNITVGIGGTVLFAQSFGQASIPMDVVFDDTTAAQPSPLPIAVTQALNGAGNIGPLPPPFLITPTSFSLNPDCASDGYLTILCQAVRSFPRAGTYHYHSALYGSTGTIIVAAP